MGFILVRYIPPIFYIQQCLWKPEEAIKGLLEWLIFFYFFINIIIIFFFLE
jgi:hypothetical protein